MFCSVVKHLGSGKALKKCRKTRDAVECFPYTSFVLYRFLRALQQNRAQSRLLYLLIKCDLCDTDYIDYTARHLHQWIEAQVAQARYMSSYMLTFALLRELERFAYL